MNFDCFQISTLGLVKFLLRVINASERGPRLKVVLVCFDNLFEQTDRLVVLLFGDCFFGLLKSSFRCCRTLVNVSSGNDARYRRGLRPWFPFEVEIVLKSIRTVAQVSLAHVDRPYTPDFLAFSFY